MNTMHVSPLLTVSPEGPRSSKTGDQIHLRQGELDGACGPYCIISALIALGLMRRSNVLENMATWKGSTREGRFRDALYDFIPQPDDELWGDPAAFVADRRQKMLTEVDRRYDLAVTPLAEGVE